MTKEALMLALEALETPRPFDSYPPLWRAYEKTINEAITAIKEALAQPEQEPVGKLQKATAERAWFTIDELNAWADKKLSENPHWVMPKDEPERDELPPQVAQPEKTVCPFCSSEWVTAEQHDRKMDRMEQEQVAWKPDRSGKYLTVVYRDLIPGDEVGEVIDHPKAVIMSWSNAVHDVQQLSNTTPPQRTWVGLTLEERDNFWKADQMTHEEWQQLFSEVEDKLRTKNGY